ncbi:MAG: DUF3800 domain-containing protein [Candidatus Micrarchaeota archaeon]|nr:DUF3800 domain-containing protein [Candidatus Micrarchaeota archaeon]
MRHIFIDESGDLGKQGARYFIISAIVANDPKRIRKIMKRFRERRLKKELRQTNEIKANSSTPAIRNYILSSLVKCDCEIFAIVADKGKILSKFDKVRDKIYHYLCALLLDKVALGDGETTIIIDQKDTNKMIKRNFRNYIQMRFHKKARKIKFNQVLSFEENGLMVVDFVAWAVNRKWNSNDDSYFNLIKDRIKNLESMELWKEQK